MCPIMPNLTEGREKSSGKERDPLERERGGREKNTNKKRRKKDNKTIKPAAVCKKDSVPCGQSEWKTCRSSCKRAQGRQKNKHATKETTLVAGH